MIALTPAARLRARIGSSVLAAALAAAFVLVVGGAFPTTAAGADRAELRSVAAAHYSAETLARGRAYRQVGYVLFFVQASVVLAVVWALAAGPLDGWSRRALALAGARPWLARIAVLTALYGALALLRFPFSAARYLHAREYGLRHDPWSGFLLDWTKGLAIGWVMLVVIGLLVLTLFAARPRSWWLLSAGAVSVLTALYVFVAPMVIDPIFNRFEKLEDPALEARVLEVADRAGVPVREVLVADASRRTRAVNAYFTGLGSTQRIVLYDTLVERMDVDEAALVVAHEAGHWQRRHILKGMALGLAAALAGLWVAHLVLGRWAADGVFGLAGRADPALVLPAYALYVTLSLAAVVPSNWISRRMETEADRAALELTADPEAFVRAEVRLGEENLADVVPPAWIEFTLYTHPANARRIRMAEQAR